MFVFFWAPTAGSGVVVGGVCLCLFKYLTALKVLNSYSSGLFGRSSNCACAPSTVTHCVCADTG